MSSLLIANIAVILLAGVSVGLGMLAVHFWRRLQAERQSMAQVVERAMVAEATLTTAPLGCLAFSSSGGMLHAMPSLLEALGIGVGKQTTLSALMDAFEDQGDLNLEDALSRLHKHGTGFRMTLRAKEGAGIFEMTGARAGAGISGTGAAGAGEPGADVVWIEDVTALHEARQRAEGERDALARLVDALPLPVWRRDETLRLVYCNQAYAQAVGETPVKALSAAVELLGKTKAKAGREIARRALKSGAPEMEAHHVVVEGARRLLEISERPAGDGTLVGHAVDSTEAGELRTELSRHVGAHAEVLENLGSAIAIFGPDMKLKFFNTSYARLWQLEESFLATEPDMSDILEALREGRRLPEHANFPEYKRTWIAKLKTLMDPIEDLQHLPDGTTLRSVISQHPFGGVLLTYEDVTDKLSLESSYNTLIEVQRETLDNLYEGVVVYGANGRLKLSNPAFARIWNLGAQLLESEPHVRQLIAETRVFFTVSDEAWEEIMETRVARATEPEARSGRRERADGTIIDWTLVPLPDGASLFTFQDVTDSIRVERALRERADAMETADRLKSEFVASISYELRTPLNAIVGFAEILEKQFFGELNERQLEYSRGIVESSEQLIALINDILDLATIEAGYLKLDVGAIDVRALMESVQKLSHERAYTQSIELKLECDKDAGSLVADARRLRQALFNLLSNAFKYTPEGGSVTLSAVRQESELRFSVADTGSGIEQEDLARVFGKFETGSGQSGQSGAGLGLSLVKSLIELHGGRVEIDSAPGSGTVVTCRIPLDQADRLAAGDGA